MLHEILWTNDLKFYLSLNREPNINLILEKCNVFKF